MRISQREAHRLRKRVDALEVIIIRQRQVWANEYVGGKQIASTGYASDSVIPTAIRTARTLWHAVVVMCDVTRKTQFIALPHHSEDIV